MLLQHPHKTRTAATGSQIRKSFGKIQKSFIQPYNRTCGPITRTKGPKKLSEIIQLTKTAQTTGHFIHTEHQLIFRRVHVEFDNIPELFFESRFRFVPIMVNW